MALDIVSLLGSIKDLLSASNTTTATIDISGSLNNRVKSFYKGADGCHDHIPVPTSLYPAIFIEIADKIETLERLGRSTRRDSDITINIVPITQYGVGTSTQGKSAENAQLENIQLCDNLENFFRNNITLSNTVTYIDEVRTTYASVKKSDQAYNIVSNIQLSLMKKHHN